MKFCKKCQNAYCDNCGKEWNYQPCSHNWSWTYPNYLQYQGQVDPNKLSVGASSINTQTANTLNAVQKECYDVLKGLNKEEAVKTTMETCAHC